MVIFKDRRTAGQLLAKRLRHLKDQPQTVVLAIPRGGVVVAAEVAKSLNLPLDVVITRKIGAPTQAELALGAVDPDGVVIWEKDLLDNLQLTTDALKEEVLIQLNEIRRRGKVYKKGQVPQDIKNKTIILVDDGIATGATIVSAIKYLKRHGVKRIILASPVAAESTTQKLSKLIDSSIILYQPEEFGAIGQFYQDFNPVSDGQVVQLLGRYT